MNTCGCKGCENPVLALGLCSKHWRRNRLYGSPFAVANQSGLLRGLPAQERFRRQYKKGEECWEWTGGTDRQFYGRFSAELHGVMHTKAHRYSWALQHGVPIPDGMVVCHSCDNPRCVNPAHLWLGTQDDNMRDKISKGRHVLNHARGEARPEAKLTESEVRVILLDARPYAVIAADYGVHTQTISSIKNRKSWAHVQVDQVAKAPRVSHRKGMSDKINDDIVREIRNSSTPGSELAERYGVSRQLITNIRKRRVWKHVE